VTVLLVEQNAHKALKIAHHACVLEQGRIDKFGTGGEIARDEGIVAAYLGKKRK
jgi:branched-chain amino acid transport system ATP-binding protein